MKPMENRLPVGPGSRGGHWHDPEFRRAYYRAWRAANPEYREREKLRRLRERAKFSSPADTDQPVPRSLPQAAQFCGCACGCRESIPLVCGFCTSGMHSEEEAS